MDISYVQIWCTFENFRVHLTDKIKHCTIYLNITLEIGKRKSKIHINIYFIRFFHFFYAHTLSETRHPATSASLHFGRRSAWDLIQ